MPLYGLLRTDRDGRLVERRQIECANDGDAISVGRALLLPGDEVCVFQAERRVVTLSGSGRMNAAAD